MKIRLVTRKTYSFRQLSLNGNEVGIQAIEIDDLTIDTTEINDSNSYGIYTLNNEVFLLQDSRLERNSAGNTDQTILKEVNRLRFDDTTGDNTFYEWSIFTTDITHDAVSDVILYRSLVSSANFPDIPMVNAIIGTDFNPQNPLTQEVNIIATADNIVGFHAVWDGIYFGQLNRTIFTMSGNGSTGSFIEQ